MKLSLIAATMALAATAAQAQDRTPRTSVLEAISGQQPPERAGKTEEIKFRHDVANRMTVAVHLDGKGPFRFVVDTAADRTAISREVAARLNLPVDSTAQLHSVAGVSEVDTTTIPRLRFSRGVLTGIEAPLLEAHNMGADGILGVDSLRAQQVRFDFEKRTMAIVPAKAPPADEKGTIVVTGKLRGGRLLLSDARVEERRVTVVLDTGSEVSVGNDAFRRLLRQEQRLNILGKAILQSVTGQVLVGDQAVVESVKFGGISLDNLAVVFADAHTFDVLGLDDKPALLLGMDALGAFEKVTIDFARKKLRVILPDQSSLDQVMMAAR